MTVFYRWLFPPLWIIVFGAGILDMRLAAAKQAEPVLLTELMYVLPWLLGAAFLFWFLRRLSDVWIEGGALIVVRGRSEERFPLAAIRSVSETRFWNPKQIKIKIRRGSGPEPTVVFIAPWRLLQAPFDTHPVVRVLRSEIGHAPFARMPDAPPE